jgi:hypothetical protein
MGGPNRTLDRVPVRLAEPSTGWRYGNAENRAADSGSCDGLTVSSLGRRLLFKAARVLSDLATRLAGW